jgi:hypothetical protein
MEEARLRAGRGPFRVFWAEARFQRPVMDTLDRTNEPKAPEFLLEFFV